VDGQQHLVYLAKVGKTAYWVPIATDATAIDDDGSQMRQSDRSNRDPASDIHEEAEKSGRNTVVESWENKMNDNCS